MCTFDKRGSLSVHSLTRLVVTGVEFRSSISSTISAGWGMFFGCSGRGRQLRMSALAWPFPGCNEFRSRMLKV